jgi:hypothetical protein
VLHQAADVVHVARQPVELRHDDGELGLASAFDRGAQLRPVIVGAALGLGVGLDQLERLGIAELHERRLLRLEPEATATLPRRADPDVANRRLHGSPCNVPSTVGLLQ